MGWFPIEFQLELLSSAMEWYPGTLVRAARALGVLVNSMLRCTMLLQYTHIAGYRYGGSYPNCLANFVKIPRKVSTGADYTELVVVLVI